MTEDNGAKTEGAEVPRELNEDQKLVHEIYGAHYATGYGINKLFDRLSLLNEELTDAKETIEHLKALIDNKNALIETYESNPENKA
jgi:hypothetical protein